MLDLLALSSFKSSISWSLPSTSVLRYPLGILQPEKNRPCHSLLDPFQR